MQLIFDRDANVIQWEKDIVFPRSGAVYVGLRKIYIDPCLIQTVNPESETLT